MQKSFFPNLESLRGFAAIFVLLFHTKKETWLYYVPFVERGHVFVDFFFVLSGFIIAYNYDNKIQNAQDSKLFVLKRVFRLYPLHVFAMFLALLGCVIAPKPNTLETYNTFVIELLLLQSIPPFIYLYNYTWNIPAWSISTEMWTYILFIPLLKRPSKKISFLIFSFIYLLVYTQSWHHLQLTGFMPLLRCIAAFALGNYIHKFYMQKPTFLLNIFADTLTIIAIIVVFFLYAYLYTSNYYFEVILSFLFAVLILLATKDDFILSTILQSRIPLYLGKISYSIYLTHSLVILFVSKFMTIVLRIPWQEQHKTVLYPLFVLVFTIVFSSFTYHFIESKFKNAYKRFLNVRIYQ